MHGKNISDSRHSLKKKHGLRTSSGNGEQFSVTTAQGSWGDIMGSGEPGGYQKKALDTCLRGYICCYWPCTSRSLLGPLQLLDLMGTFPGPLSLELSHCSSVRFTVSSGFSEPLSSTQLLICASGFKALKTVWIWSKLFQKGFDILPLVLYATGKWH